MRLLLDTHAFAWAVMAPLRLPTPARLAVEDGANEVFVSAASMWEISIKHHAGKWPDAERLLDESERAMRDVRFTEMPITAAHGCAAGALAGPHRDPFDRLLIAQARIERLRIVTADRVFPAYDVATLWDA